MGCDYFLSIFLDHCICTFQCSIRFRMSARARSHSLPLCSLFIVRFFLDVAIYDVFVYLSNDNRIDALAVRLLLILLLARPRFATHMHPATRRIVDKLIRSCLTRAHINTQTNNRHKTGWTRVNRIAHPVNVISYTHNVDCRIHNKSQVDLIFATFLGFFLLCGVWRCFRLHMFYFYFYFCLALVDFDTAALSTTADRSNVNCNINLFIMCRYVLLVVKHVHSHINLETSRKIYVSNQKERTATTTNEKKRKKLRTRNRIERQFCAKRRDAWRRQEIENAYKSTDFSFSYFFNGFAWLWYGTMCISFNITPMGANRSRKRNNKLLSVSGNGSQKLVLSEPNICSVYSIKI